LTTIKGIISVLLLSVLILAVLPTGNLISAVEVEPNGDFSLASTLVPATPTTGTINASDPSDFYKFTVTAAQMIGLKLEGLGGTGAMHIKLYYPSHEVVLTGSDVFAGNTGTYNSSTGQDTPGTHFVEVAGQNMSYKLTLVITNQNDAGKGTDASDDVNAPTLIVPGPSMNGWISDDDEVDIYGFNVAEAKNITIHFQTGQTSDYTCQAQLFTPYNVKIGDTGPLGKGKASTMTYTSGRSTTGTYYIMVTGTSNTYQFTVTLDMQNDSGSGTDAMDDFPGVSVHMGPHYKGWLSGTDNKDFYTTEVLRGDRLEVRVTDGQTYHNSTLNLTLYNYAHNKIGETGPIHTVRSLYYTAAAESAAVYYFSVTGANEYMIEVIIRGQNDANYSRDAPASLYGALELKNGNYTGWLADMDTIDAYNITVKANHTFQINFSGADAPVPTMMLDLLNSTQDLIIHIESVTGVPQTYILPDKDAPYKDTVYYLKVFGGNGSGYRIEVYLPYKELDRRPPMINITSPPDDQLTNSLKTTIKGTASDLNGTIMKVAWSLNNSTWTDCSGSDSWSCIVSLVSGTNHLTVRATDLSGNKAYDVRTLNYDAVLPSLTLTAPADLSVVNLPLIIVTGNASDNIGIAKIEIQVNGGSWETLPQTAGFSYPTTLKTGGNTISVRVTDTAGNSITQTRAVIYKKPAPKGFIPGFETIPIIVAILVAFVAIGTRRKS
jgi:hypothetical protein